MVNSRQNIAWLIAEGRKYIIDCDMSSVDGSLIEYLLGLTEEKDDAAQAIQSLMEEFNVPSP